MTSVRRRLPALLIAALVAGGCGDRPPTPSPSASPSQAPTATPAPTERAFAPAAWPQAGSACGVAGYGGLIGRIEATGPRTVRFTLCAPDGAFQARLAHPSLGVLDTVVVERVEADPSTMRDVGGAGAFRVDAWSPGDNVQLVRVTGNGAPGGPGPSGGAGASGGAGPSGAPASRPSATLSPSPAGSGASPNGSARPAAGPPSVIVLRWAADPSARTSALQGAEVDGIDDPGAADLDTISTLPELEILPRPGLATAYLGFGTGFQLGKTSVRRAFGQGVDRTALAGDAAGPDTSTTSSGATAADYLAPCVVAGGCVGTPWYDFNGPAGSAALDDAGFDRKTAIPLHVPDGPVPGLGDPGGLADAVAAQLQDSLGIKVHIEAEPAASLAADVAARRVDGLFLAGVASPVADAVGYLEPLFADGAQSLTAARARSVTQALDDAAGVTDPAQRRAALGKANDALLAAVPLVPLTHPGTVTAWRADVTGAAVSPIGADPLGTFVPADRSQVVAMGAVEPSASWCGATASLDALRLCALVTPGLYAFDGASLDAVPALASGCTPNEGARVWTCRLRSTARFAGGAQLDAGDVVASFRAIGDATSPLRTSLPADAFAIWDGLFGGPVPDPAP